MRMNKIPVLGTVSRAYGFLIGDFVTILRLVWVPLLGAAVVQYYFGGEIMAAAMRTAQSADPTRMMETMPQQFLLGIVQYVAGIIAIVALLRVVISGDRKPGLFVYFWFGSAEIRLIAVTLLLIVAGIAGVIGVGIVFGILGAIAAQVPVLGVVLVIAAVVLSLVLLWIALRLTLISPVIVAESGLGVERSWALMRGNALRMFVIVLLTFLPLAIVSWIVFLAVLGGDFPPFPDIMGMMKPGEGAQATQASVAIQEAMKHWQTALMEAYSKHWPEVSALGFVYNVVSTALLAGVTGSAYVSATGKAG
jgi:hypothetical protein